MAPPATIDDGLALIETIASFGSHRISFGRDPTDSFFVTVDRLSSDAPDFEKDRLLPLLPRGSGWNPAVGWRSFVVLPFDVPGTCAAAVGVEGVVPHASRGAFPIMRAFLVRAADVSPALTRLADGGSAGGSSAASAVSAAIPEDRCVIWSSDARSPGEHQRHEAPMLRAAAARWRGGEAKLLRTVLLSQDQVPWPNSWIGTMRALGNPDQALCYLVATVPPIRAHFSRSTRLTLLGRELLA